MAVSPARGAHCDLLSYWFTKGGFPDGFQVFGMTLVRFVLLFSWLFRHKYSTGSLIMLFLLVNKCCSARQAATWFSKRAENKRDVEILIFLVFKLLKELDTSFQAFLLARSFCLEMWCFFRINRVRSLTPATNIRWPALRVGLLTSNVFPDSSSRAAKRAYASSVSPKGALWSSPTHSTTRLKMTESPSRSYPKHYRLSN